MSSNRIVVGQSEWTFPEGDVAKTLELIKSAMENGSVAELELVDASGRTVSVYLNGAVVPTVVVDLGDGARPSEIS
jgi:hypothetical protein